MGIYRKSAWAPTPPPVSGTREGGGWDTASHIKASVSQKYDESTRATSGPLDGSNSIAGSRISVVVLSLVWPQPRRTHTTRNKGTWNPSTSW